MMLAGGKDSEGHGRRKSRRVRVGYQFDVCAHTGRRRPRGFDSTVARNRSSHRKLKPRGDRDEGCVFGLSSRSRRSRDQVRIRRTCARARGLNVSPVQLDLKVKK
ncbi:hypothetical protein OOU_Y34scaffold00624g15 [Pyricularia oryzae Y34]|uniref:Uncharacterized protein n=1 Tax=Pyricularia oryzae (strain Y34) TaxID=1143189 RepID=A0AA97PJL0_PYRO3|nr:hypothetical protein OOU_Y34scaffold00624g15 [Pyricularia oryzae Y34]